MDVQFHRNNITGAATLFWKHAGNKKVFAFHGEMGAGKTTFISALCVLQKVSSSVSSPTFSIINEYSYPNGKIYHIDLYRLQHEDEVLRAGIEDCLYSGAICFIEWPDRMVRLFPPGTVHVFLEVIDTNNRRLRIGDN